MLVRKVFLIHVCGSNDASSGLSFRDLEFQGNEPMAPWVFVVCWTAVGDIPGGSRMLMSPSLSI